MSSVYLTPASISFLTQLILSVSISVFLVRRLWKRRTRQLALLTGFFVPVTLFIGLMFLDAALSPFYRLLVVYAENAVLALALVFLIQFAYHFPQKYPQHKLESCLGLVISLAYFAWEASYMVFRYYSLFVREMVYYRPGILAYSMAVVLLFAPIAFIRQTVAADPRPVSFVRKLWKPEGKDSRGARSFVSVFAIMFVLGLTNVALIFRLSHTVYNAVMSIGILVALWLFATNYINFIPGGVNVQAKLSVLSLTLFLALLGSVGWFIAPPYIATFQPNLSDHQTLRFTPDGSGGYVVADVAFAFESELGENINPDSTISIYGEGRSRKLNYTFPFYGQTYDEIYIANSGIISFGEPFWQPNLQARTINTPAIFPLMVELDPDLDDGGGIYARQDAETGRLTVTWDHLPSPFRPEAAFTFQASLYPDGVFEITTNGLPLPLIFDPDATPSANPWIRGAVPGRGEQIHAWEGRLQDPYDPDDLAIIENYHLDFRRYLHEFMLPVAWIMVGGSLALMIGLPLLMRYSVVRPLENLTQGVQRMEAGNLTVEVPIQNEDEIGYLTGAFNAMTAQLAQLVAELEQRFQQIFQYEPDYCYMISPQGIILDANPAALEVLGYTREELIGQSVSKIYAPESQAHAWELLEKWRRTGELVNEELTILSKEGERRSISLSAGMVRDEQGDILHAISIQRDITERLQAEKTMLELAAIEERRRLASDLHDSMTQSLHSLTLSAETAQQLHQENRHEKLDRALQMLGDGAYQALREMRLLCYQLQLMPEEQINWFEILETRLQTVEQRMGITTELRIENPEMIFKDCRREIFYIITEALNNTLKHSRADFVSVSVQGTPYRLTVAVRDNGLGFDVDQANKSGMGLSNIAERAAHLGAELQVDSAPGIGTTVRLEMLNRQTQNTQIQDKDQVL